MGSVWVWTICFVLSFESIGAFHEFTVGGSEGWLVPSGTQSYNLWAGINRFQINDTLLFKYDGKVDSVLQVTHQNYQTCNTTSPIKSFKDGNTTFKLDHQGPFYFISGNSSNCKKGEKLMLVVISLCHSNLGQKCKNSTIPSKSPTPSPSPSPIPSPRISPSPSSTPTPIHSISPTPTFSPSFSPLSPPAESPQIITPSSSSNFTSPGPAPIHSSSSSSATSLANLVIPLLLVALLNPIL